MPGISPAARRLRPWPGILTASKFAFATAFSTAFGELAGQRNSCVPLSAPRLRLDVRNLLILLLPLPPSLSRFLYFEVAPLRKGQLRNVFETVINDTQQHCGETEGKKELNNCWYKKALSSSMIPKAYHSSRCP
eukprot:3839851-Rhodomonas_salina.1